MDEVRRRFFDVVVLINGGEDWVEVVIVGSGVDVSGYIILLRSCKYN